MQKTTFAPLFLLLAPYAALIAACLIAYSNVYHNAFLYDDILLMKSNRLLQSWDNIGPIFTTTTTVGNGGHDPFYRPLQILLYLIIYQSFGLSAVPFHLLNVGLHSLNACLGFRLGKKLGFRPLAVFAGVLLWSVHPINTEAVTYMSATADVLSTFFCLLGLLLFMQRPQHHLIYSSLFMGLALLSKESAIVFPALAMSVIFMQSNARWSARAYTETLIFWGIAGSYLIIRLGMLSMEGGSGFFHPAAIYSENFDYRLYTFLATLPTYFVLLLMPEHLHMGRDLPVYTDFLIPRVMEGMVLSFLMVAAVVQRPKHPATPLGWGVLWFMLAFLPYTGIFLPINGTFYEHWLYMPALGLSTGLIVGVDRIVEAYPFYRKVVLGSVALAALILTGFTLNQNTVWRDPISFYTHMFSEGERAPQAHNNLGTFYYDTGDLDKAIEQFQIAIRVSTNYAMPYYNMAITLLRRDASAASIAEAKKDLEKSVDINPNYLPAYTVLADICAASGDREKEAYYRKLATPVTR